MRANTRSRNWMLLALGAAALALSACGGKEEGRQAEPAGATVRAEVVTVAAAPMHISTEVPGTVISDQQVQVSSRLMGYIRDIKVQEGEAVRKGQLLFSIDPADVQAQINQARAGLAQAEAGLAGARLNYERYSALYRDESIPKAQFEQARTQYQMAQSQVAAARAGLNAAGAQLRYADVRSPIDGVVVQKLGVAGDLAAPGRPILVLENPAALQVQVAVSGDTYATVKQGDPVQVRLEGRAEPVTGTVLRILPAADPATHSYTIKVALPGVSGVRSGSFARVGFAQGTREAIQVPRSAVLERAGIPGVFVVDAQGVAHYRMVRTGAETDGRVEIQAGLNPGERVVVSNNATLQSGDRIVGAPRHG